MKNQVHYNLDNINQKYPDAFYYLIYGEKSNGKSYQVKHKEAVLHYIETKKKFVLLRRWKDDISTAWIEKYFSDVDVEKITNGKYNAITTYRKDIYFSKIDDNLKVKRGEKIGTCIALSQEQHYSGASFLDYDRIIFEEFMERGVYIGHESEKLQILYSTIDRKRGETKVYMVGNTISRVCPYLYDWDLLSLIRNQKQGQILIKDTGTTYETNEGEKKVTIAIEYCLSSGGKSLAFGEASSMIDSGAWQSRKQPKLESSKKDYNILLRIGFEYSGFRFIGELLKKDSNIIWFIYPYKKDFSKDLIVFSDKVKETKMYQKDIYNITIDNPDLQNLFRDTFRESNIFYSDDLTGTDFLQAIDFTIRR